MTVDHSCFAKSATAFPTVQQNPEYAAEIKSLAAFLPKTNAKKNDKTK